MRLFRRMFNTFVAAFPLVIVVAAILVILLARDLNRRIVQTDRHIVDLTATALRLERDLGYGGFIHHFKNYVLRPDETVYRDGAEAALAKALDGIARLEAIGADTGTAFDLTSAREVLLAYAAEVATISRMARAGASPAEIDTEVRVDDTAALGVLTMVIDEIHGRYERQAVSLRNDMDRLGMLFVFLATIVYVSLGCQLFRAIYLRPNDGRGPMR